MTDQGSLLESILDATPSTPTPRLTSVAPAERPPATGMTLESVVERLRDTATRKLDVVLNTKDHISLVPMVKENGIYRPADEAESAPGAEGVEVGAMIYGTGTKLDGAGILQVTPWAHQQMSDRVGIPWKYYQRMMERDVGLLMENVHAWWHNEPQYRMARTLEPNGTPGRIRAWVSNGYRVLDDLDFAVTVLEAAEEFGARIHTCNVDDQRLYIQLVTDMTAEISPDDAIQLGVQVRNSEVGDGRIEVSPWVYRRWCKNGATSTKNYCRVHLGSKQDLGILSEETLQKQNEAIWSEVRDWVRFALDQANLRRIVAMFKGTKEVPVEEEAKVAVGNVVKRFGMNQGEANAVLERFLRQNDDTAFGLINAVTREAQERPSYRRRMEFEEIGGEMMEMKPKELASVINAPMSERVVEKLFIEKN